MSVPAPFLPGSSRGKNAALDVTNDGVRVEIERRPAGDEITGWRREQLLLSGFSPRLAARVAADSRYDLHRLIELVERGCRPELAMRILAPLDDPAEAA